jgi:hypothetical protein
MKGWAEQARENELNILCKAKRDGYPLGYAKFLATIGKHRATAFARLRQALLKPDKKQGLPSAIAWTLLGISGSWALANFGLGAYWGYQLSAHLLGNNLTAHLLMSSLGIRYFGSALNHINFNTIAVLSYGAEQSAEFFIAIKALAAVNQDQKIQPPTTGTNISIPEKKINLTPSFNSVQRRPLLLATKNQGNQLLRYPPIQP